MHAHRVLWPFSMVADSSEKRNLSLRSLVTYKSVMKDINLEDWCFELWSFAWRVKYAITCITNQHDVVFATHQKIQQEPDLGRFYCWDKHASKVVRLVGERWDFCVPVHHATRLLIHKVVKDGSLHWFCWSESPKIWKKKVIDEMDIIRLCTIAHRLTCSCEVVLRWSHSY